MACLTHPQENVAAIDSSHGCAQFLRRHDRTDSVEGTQSAEMAKSCDNDWPCLLLEPLWESCRWGGRGGGGGREREREKIHIKPQKSTPGTCEVECRYPARNSGVQKVGSRKWKVENTPSKVYLQFYKKMYFIMRLVVLRRGGVPARLPRRHNAVGDTVGASPLTTVRACEPRRCRRCANMLSTQRSTARMNGTVGTG
jgi:hypothetical protein